jgi:tetratricopeptide (TPR) repeat protein
MVRQMTHLAAVGSLILTSSALALGQSGSTRPRRVNQAPTTTEMETNSSSVQSSQPSSGSRESASSGAPSGASNTAHAYSLLQAKQYTTAATEAKQIAAANPADAEAWKIAGFAEYNLKQYSEAATDLQRALDLQRKANQEDSHTVDALAQVYVFNKNFDLALPLLVIATSRKGAPPDADLLYYRGIAEYRTGKTVEAERSFNAAVKANPKSAGALFYLGEIAYRRNDFDAAIPALNRATINDPRVAAAWELLTESYLRRAQAQSTAARADADYLGAVRAGEGLTRIQADERGASLFARALIGAKQYTRAASVLEPVAAGDNAQGATLYLLGFAYVQAKNYPKAIAALERAAIKTPDDANIFRLQGYAYEVSKQYAKALAAYEKAAQLAPSDAELKQSVERVRPFAK